MLNKRLYLWQPVKHPFQIPQRNLAYLNLRYVILCWDWIIFDQFTQDTGRSGLQPTADVIGRSNLQDWANCYKSQCWGKEKATVENVRAMTTRMLSRLILIKSSFNLSPIENESFKTWLLFYSRKYLENMSYVFLSSDKRCRHFPNLWYLSVDGRTLLK
jgi:hypothetical protein